MDEPVPQDEPGLPRPRRRPRYPGKYPRRFEHRYKELAADRFPETVAKVIASGKTPAGTHRPIMVDEVLRVLAPEPGNRVVDCTLGHGGHAEALLQSVLPGGRLLGLEQDPAELPRTEARLRAQGYGPDVFLTRRTNFAGLGQALTQVGWTAADLIFADLGVSSMQLDNPSRGFSYKQEGPLDMRMNPGKGEPASNLIQRASAEEITVLLEENADEPQARLLASKLAGRRFDTTTQLVRSVRLALRGTGAVEAEAVVRRVFQALRIAVNDELGVLDNLLRQLPHCLAPGGRAAILAFHSGEDRRVKRAFTLGLQQQLYQEIAREVIRPSAEEVRANPRAASAKLRWARRAPSS